MTLHIKSHYETIKVGWIYKQYSIQMNYCGINDNFLNPVIAYNVNKLMAQVLLDYTYIIYMFYYIFSYFI